jgi:hypothetical protein
MSTSHTTAPHPEKRRKTANIHIIYVLVYSKHKLPVLNKNMFSGIAECEAQECVLSDHQEIAVFTAEQVPAQMMSDIRDMAEKEPLILYETDGNDAINNAIDRAREASSSDEGEEGKENDEHGEDLSQDQIENIKQIVSDETENSARVNEITEFLLRNVDCEAEQEIDTVGKKVHVKTIVVNKYVLSLNIMGQY